MLSCAPAIPRTSVFFEAMHFFPWFFHYPIIFQINMFSNFFENLTQFTSKTRLAQIRKFAIKILRVSDYWPWKMRKKNKLEMEKLRILVILLVWYFVNWYIFQKLGMKAIWMLEISCSKSCDSETNLPKSTGSDDLREIFAYLQNKSLS